jgi:spermidine/putrescine transport system substrate-binding protein
MAYHADHANNPTSWADAKTDDLKVSHFDHGLPRFGNSAAFIGVDPNEALKDTELYQEVFAEVEDQHQYVGTYWGTGDEFMRLYREESAHIGSGWGGRIAVLQQDGLNVGYTVPEEGAYPGGACWTIVKESENKDYIYEFLDWLYQRENVVELNQKFGYPYPLKDAPEEVTSLPDYLDTPDKLLNLNVGPFMASVQQLQQDFATIKQGGSVSSSAPQA